MNPDSTVSQPSAQKLNQLNLFSFFFSFSSHLRPVFQLQVFDANKDGRLQLSEMAK
jgi:hypothetical protein